MNILMTICARGGSKGVKNKNIRPLCGKPLIAHTIEQGRAWGKADHIVISTDSEAIAEVARQWQAEVPFIRPPELATDTAGKLLAIRHALKASENIYRKTFDVVVDLDATAPLRTVKDIEGAFQLFCSTQADTVFSVVRAHRNPYFNMVEDGNDGYCHLVKALPGGVTSRQAAPKVYDMNASIYFYKAEYVRNEANVTAISARSKVYLMEDISARDIDSELDLNYVEYLIKQGVFVL
jgi:CMP-N,N'-diacetyllegionaminic acid synthase